MSDSSASPGLYLHVPFCARACPYCDFDFEVPGSRKLASRVELWLEGLEHERAVRGLGGKVETVYLGGGTPSSLGPTGLERVFGWIDRHFDRSGAREVTVELNPEHVDLGLLEALDACRVDRVSLGVQSLASEGLRVLGRAHDEAQARRAIEACASRFACSVDLILGWEGQHFERGAQALRPTLEVLDASRVDHLSTYALTIEEGSAWPGLVRRGLRRDPDEAEQSELLERTEAWLVEHGWTHYEVSSYARGGALAVHNQLYWSSRDYWGLGPSASSAAYVLDGDGLTVARRSNPRGLDAWFEAGGDAELDMVDAEAAAGEALWLGLRQLDRGIDVDAFCARFVQVDRAWIEGRCARQVELGNLEYLDAGRRLRVARGRWAFHDSIALDLVAHGSQSG